MVFAKHQHELAISIHAFPTHPKPCSHFPPQTTVTEANVRNPARDKVMRKEADICKACSDFPSGNS